MRELNENELNHVSGAGMWGSIGNAIGGMFGGCRTGCICTGPCAGTPS
ncbi:hypothetical protein NUKP33_52660 [Klebsiella variicola]|nr:hypothetical protein NUKP33_52660 [Klebsiella variicola]VVL13121.1 Uncharacterised protein [Klebsiella variicola]